MVKIKIGGAPLPDDLARVEAAIEVIGGGDGVAVDANGRFDRTGPWPTPRRCPGTACAGTRRRPTRSTTP